MDFKKNIYNLRTWKNMSQGDLARELNVHQTAVSQWETGRTMPDIDTLSAVARLFSVSVDEILGNTDYPLEPWKVDKRIEEIQSLESKGIFDGRPQSIDVDDFTYAMQSEARNLTPEDKNMLLGMARQLSDARKKRNGEVIQPL